MGKPNGARKPSKKRQSRSVLPARFRALLKRIGWRRGALGALFAVVFAFGFYLATVYADISGLIEQRRAALTSAIYSAPLIVSPGDSVASTHLLDRLDQ